MVAAANESVNNDSSPGPSQLVATDSPPIISINGNNPATVDVGSVYNDLGATITGQVADLNLGIKTFVNGVFASTPSIDTSTAATDTIDYVVTDSNGLTSTSTRTVIVQASPDPITIFTIGTTTSTTQDATTTP